MNLKVPPLLLAAIFAGAMAGLARLVPAAGFALPARVAVAAGIGILGLAIVSAAVISFRTHGTTVNPMTPAASTAVVTGGVFRFSRNPMYLGMLVALAGWAAYLANVTAFLLLPVFVIYLNRFQIRPEEQALLARFGPPYSQYMAAVRRWI
jgi:protein-S-isoprenylcysteine O-methyltransferase Ste14